MSSNGSWNQQWQHQNSWSEWPDWDQSGSQEQPDQNIAQQQAMTQQPGPMSQQPGAMTQQAGFEQNGQYNWDQQGGWNPQAAYPQQPYPGQPGMDPSQQQYAAGFPQQQQQQEQDQANLDSSQASYAAPSLDSSAGTSGFYPGAVQPQGQNITDPSSSGSGSQFQDISLRKMRRGRLS